MRRFTVRLVFSAVIIAVGVTAVAVGASMLVGQAQSVVPTLTPPRLATSGPIIQASGLRPGHARRSEVTITNSNSQDADLWISGKRTGGDSLLYDNLLLKIYDGSFTTRWSGMLWELNAQRNTGFFGRGDTRKMFFDLQLAPWAGNELQSKTAEFDLNFSFRNDLTTDPSADVEPPRSRILTKRPSRKVKKSRRNWLIRGTAVDDLSPIVEVKLSMIRIVKRSRKRARTCLTWVPSRKKMVRTGLAAGKCRQSWFSTVGKSKWSYLFPLRRLPTGTYVILSRAIDSAGNIETTFSNTRGNRITYKNRKKRKQR